MGAVWWGGQEGGDIRSMCWALGGIQASVEGGGKEETRQSRKPARRKSELLPEWGTGEGGGEAWSPVPPTYHFLSPSRRSHVMLSRPYALFYLVFTKPEGTPVSISQTRDRLSGGKDLRGTQQVRLGPWVVGPPPALGGSGWADFLVTIKQESHEIRFS